LPKGIQDERYRHLIEKLIDARRARGLSQVEVAELLGTHQQFVSRYEIGERRLDVIEFCDIARALALDPVKLVERLK
jgi:transcriptional regulator with XRE-family HTH domain